MGKKNRPKRIIEGWVKKITGKTDKTTQSRRAVCNSCPLIKRGVIDTCGKCGCEIEAKTAVKEEYCPVNRWADIKFFSKGLVVRNINTEKVSLSYDEELDTMTVEYNEPMVTDEGFSEKTKFTLELINSRGDFDISSSMVTLENIQVNGCGCFQRDMSANKLREGESLTVDFTYNTNLSGNVSKTYKIATSQDVFTLKIKGKR